MVPAATAKREAPLQTAELSAFSTPFLCSWNTQAKTFVDLVGVAPTMRGMITRKRLKGPRLSLLR
jgi:hypothetical protein